MLSLGLVQTLNIELPNVNMNLFLWEPVQQANSHEFATNFYYGLDANINADKLTNKHANLGKQYTPWFMSTIYSSLSLVIRRYTLVPLKTPTSAPSTTPTSTPTSVSD